MTVNLTKISIFLLVFMTTLSLSAGETEFNFADPKGVNSMSISIDSELEPIMGTASGISGMLKFNPDNPESISGMISVATKDIHTSNQRMTKVLHSEDWIHAEGHPTVEFKFKSIKTASKKGDTLYELQVRGDFTLKGVTKEIQVPITLSYLPGKLAARQEGVEGDLLILRSQFSILRKDFNIKPDMGISTVANKIDIQVGIVGFAPKN